MTVTPVNFIDVLMQAESPRVGASPNAALLVSASAPAFVVAVGGASALPTSITVSANPVNITGSGKVTFAATGATIASNGVVAILTFANMTAPTATITASITDQSGVIFTGVQTITQVLNGNNGTNGTNGSSGTNGIAGTSYLTAYMASTIPTVVGNSETDAGATTVPADTWGLGGTWQTTVPILTAGEYQYQSDGIYNPASNQTIWSLPYWSSLKVGSLSAITANLGTVTAGTIQGCLIETGTSGAHITLNEGGNNALIVYDATGIASIVTLNGMGSNPLSAQASLASYAVGYCGNASTGAGFEGTSAHGAGIAGYSTYGYGAAFWNGGSSLAISAEGAINPLVNNGYALGASGLAWSGIWSATAVVVTSDARTKTDIVDTDLGLAFINLLRPVKYKHQVGANVPEFTAVAATVERQNPRPIVSYSPRSGVRNHYGLIAQEVKAAMSTHGLDDAAFWTLADKDNPNSQQALRYEELLAPVVKAIQELSAQMQQLQAQWKVEADVQ